MWENKQPLSITKTCLTSFPLLQNGSWTLWPQCVPFPLVHCLFFYHSGELFLCWSALCSPAGCTVQTLSAASGCRLACFLIMKIHFLSLNTGKNRPVIGSHESPAVTRDLETAGPAGTFTLGHLTSQQTTRLFKICPWNLLLC